VTDPDFAGQFVQTALDTYGRLDIIVNNAGYTWDNVIQKTTDEQWYAMLDVHLTAPFRILRAASGYIRAAAKAEAAAGAPVVRKVVNVSSLSGVLGNAGQIGYAAGKAGINGMTKTLAKEWGRYQVTVNSVAAVRAAARLGVLAGTQVAYTERRCDHSPVTTFAHAPRLPAHATALGKALLAFSPRGAAHLPARRGPGGLYPADADRSGGAAAVPGGDPADPGRGVPG
jgi:NAD(P)-dependent dehydrogenase (short-subunit alcohol dehydrogenase family)